MKQASGLLGTRGCPGLTISKPKKLKVRSNAARKKEKTFYSLGIKQQLKVPTKTNFKYCINTSSDSANTYLYHLCSCGNK